MSKSIDEAGNRYGSLTVLRAGDRGCSGELKWYVRCDCRPEIEYQVSGLNLRSGNSQGCRHCSRKKRIVRVEQADGSVKCLVQERRKLIPMQTRFGRLEVMRRGPDAGRGHTQWWVRCDCGSPEKLVQGGKLRGGPKSCGCLSGGLLSDAAKRQMLRQIKGSADIRGLPWTLSEAQVYALTSQACHYCGSLPGNTCKVNRQEGKSDGQVHNYTGIDRLDNDVQRFHTTVQVPLNTPVLVGGTTADPTADQPAGKELYLIIEAETGK